MKCAKARMTTRRMLGGQCILFSPTGWMERIAEVKLLGSKQDDGRKKEMVLEVTRLTSRAGKM